MSEPYRTSGLACPHCPGASLREYQQRYACDECNGILIGFDDLKSAVEDLAYVAQTLGYRAERATEIRCPRCERAMTACRLTTTGERTVALDVELLRCDRDGLWLPDGAMAALFAKIGRRWGGAPAPQGAMSRLTNLDAGTPGLGSAPPRGCGSRTGETGRDAGPRRSPRSTPTAIASWRARGARRRPCSSKVIGGPARVARGRSSRTPPWSRWSRR